MKQIEVDWEGVKAIAAAIVALLLMVWVLGLLV